MLRQILPVGALLLGSALLLFAGGITSLILPVRGSAEGFSAVSLGLLGTGWAFGYVAGCIVTPRLVAAVGHIRAFGVMASLAGVSVLMSALIVTPEAWIPFRSIAGFCFAGAAMIVEGWLSERANPQNRGKIFGIYTMVNLLASTGGQMSLTLGDTTGFVFFVLAAIFYSLAVVPTAVSTSASPKPLVSVGLDLRTLWKNSPVAVMAVFLVGVSNASFGTLGAVYADRVGLELTTIALFASLPILAGAVAQIPVGIASDRMDRRKVLVAVAVIALIADAAFIVLMPQGALMNLFLSATFGAMIFAMYPIIVAHANDHAPEGTGIQVSGGLLMVFGVGSILGPLVAGVAMSTVGNSGLFMVTAVSHVAMIAFALWRISKRSGMATADKGNFKISVGARGSTPQTLDLASGKAEAAPLSAEAVDEAQAEQLAAAREAAAPEPEETPAADDTSKDAPKP